MGVAFQAFSLSPELFDSLMADADAASSCVSSHYCKDEVGNGFEAVWLDKTGIGILEAFGMVSGDPDPVISWMMNASVMSVGEEPSPCLTPEMMTSDVAELIGPISDSDFATRAQSNVIETEVDYLMWGFAALRDLIVRAAAQGRGVLLYASG